MDSAFLVGYIPTSTLSPTTLTSSDLILEFMRCLSSLTSRLLKFLFLRIAMALLYLVKLYLFRSFLSFPLLYYLLIPKIRLHLLCQYLHHHVGVQILYYPFLLAHRQ